RRLERPRDAATADVRGAEPGDPLALEQDLARREGNDTGNQIEDGALAGAVGADEAVDRSGRDRHREVGDGLQPAEVPGDGAQLKEQGRLPWAWAPVAGVSGGSDGRRREAPRVPRARRAS